MAPMKRSRNNNGDPEETMEVYDVENASLSLRRNSVRGSSQIEDTELTIPQNKRARVSYDRPESEDSMDTTDDELEEIQATQFSNQQRSKEVMDNRPADNGIIETVTCSNFMCHGFLEVTLGPLINFIIGHNGSGKSAVLTAITLCLGGKATTTNRGQSLKSFIKQGQETCVLSVKIKNTADSAYQPEVYGDSIIVERQFTRAGASGFKLKSSSGRLISTRKSDLDEICDYFALQIDNPMNVLTQDMARQFLNQSGPAEKYKFFMRGTQLEQLSNDYVLIAEDIDTIQQQLDLRGNDIKVYEDAANKAKSLQAMSEKHDSLRLKLRRYANQMAWAQVEEQESQLASYDRDLRKADQTIAGMEQKSRDIDQKYEDADLVHNTAKENLQRCREQLDPLLEEKSQMKQEFDQVKHDAVTNQTEQRSIHAHLKAANTRAAKAKVEITDEIKKLEQANGGGHAKRLGEIEDKKGLVREAESRLEEHDGSLHALNEAKRHAEIEVQKAQEPLHAKRRDVDQCEEQLANLERDRGQQRGAWPAHMTRLLNAIRQEEGFLQKPVGPIGNYVRLMKPLWSSILEKSFGGMLNSFVVTSKQDQTKLSTLMHRVGCSFPILIGNHFSIDLAGHEPEREFLTWLRALEIDDDLVQRQLIVNNGIEQTLLIEDRSEAVKVMGRIRPQNVRRCFSVNANQAGAGVSISPSFGNSLSQTYVAPFRGVPRMKTDIEYQINIQRGALEKLKGELKILEQRYREAQAQHKAAGESIVRNQRRRKELEAATRAAQSVVDKLLDAMDEDAVDEGRLGALRESLKDAEDEKAMHEGSFEESIITKDKLTDILKTCRNRMTNMDEKIAEVEVTVRKAENKVEKLSTARQAALREKNAALELVEEEKVEKRRLHEEREEKARTVEEFVTQANRVCSRVAVEEGETGHTLDAKLKKLNNDLRRYEQQLGGDKRQIAENAARAVEAFETARQQIVDLDQLSSLLKLTLATRQDRWRKFQKFITARARLQFGYLLSERSFRGKLKANHREKLLELHVQPDETQTGKGRQTKTLSGGEKSFSTICLLLSLWEAMGAPIRCLDEFDVFMDSVNRDVSMKMMIIAARRSVGRQFILITPQAMGPVDTDRDVKIIRLGDPERGQTTLSFPKT